MIPYLNGNETASAVYMNALYADFDDKLSKLLAGGKSFFLAQNAAMPPKFCGRAFFFTSGAAVYAGKVPGWIDSGGSVTRPYNHAQFTAAIAAIDPTKITWDETNKVANVPSFPASAYAGLATNFNTSSPPQVVPVGNGLLDWSMQAHTIMHQGSTDSQPVPYYILENSSTGPFLPATLTPEKKYKFCVAEIIIEGPTAVSLPATYDKYSCFRIHNLNAFAVTVDFAGVYSVTLQAFQCGTVRRDAPDANYRAGYNFFWKYEPGDPRFYWFTSKGYTTAGVKAISPDDSGLSVTNSMQANNLTNPAILLDWVNFFLRDLAVTNILGTNALDANGFYAGWQQDTSVQYDAYKYYTDLFGDPSNPNTLLGDLLHHKGDIMIIRSSKTAFDPTTGKPVLVLDSVKFKGYATIVADFALKGLAVTENGSGNLVIANADTNNNVFLIPYGTNMFKVGETHPTCVSLVGKTFTIETAVFENPDPIHLATTAPQFIFQPTASTSQTSKQWFLWDPVKQTYSINSPVNGNPNTILNWNTFRTSAKALGPIHKTKVSDLLTLDYWGEPTVSGQSSTYVTITNKKLTLTPEGLLLTFTETDSSLHASNDLDWLLLKRGLPIVKSISFRGHGWGYFSGAVARDTGWLSPRSNRYLFSGAYSYESIGPSGKDFEVGGSQSSTVIKLLGRLKISSVSGTGRFWATNPTDFLAKFMSNASGDPLIFNALFGSSSESTINSGTAPVVTGTIDPTAMALIPEMYNALARASNAINRISPLNWKCLLWNVFGYSVGLFPSTLLAPSSAASTFQLFQNGLWDPTTNKTTPDTVPLKSGVGIPGWFYTVIPSGSNSTVLDGISDWKNGDIALFTPSGVWVKQPSRSTDVQVWGSYAGIIPMSCFAKFDSGSQYESLCKKIGIPVRTDADLPGGTLADGSGPNVPKVFKFFQGQTVLNGVYIDEVIASASNVNVDFSGPVVASADIAGDLISELLPVDIAFGSAVGSHCLGTWNDSLLVPAGGTNTIGGSLFAIGRYYVVQKDMTSSSPDLGDLKQGDLVIVDHIVGDLNGTYYDAVRKNSMATFYNKRMGVTSTGFDLNRFSTDAGGIRWITIADVATAVEALGFQFNYFEKCVPYSLFTFVRGITQSGPLFPGSTSGSFHSSGEISIPPFPSFTGPWPVAPAYSLRFSTDPRLGFMVKFCEVADTGALWKSTNFQLQAGVNQIASVSPAQDHSPVVHASRGSISWDAPSMTVGTGFGISTGSGFQLLGQMNQIIGTSRSTYDIGYIIREYRLNPYDLINRFDNAPGELPPTFSDTAHESQFHVEAFLVSVSGSLTAFPTQVILQGDEMWKRTTDWWALSLLNMNTYVDSLYGAIGNTSPYEYVPPPANITITLGNGLNVMAADRNKKYRLLYNIGVLIISV